MWWCAGVSATAAILYVPTVLVIDIPPAIAEFVIATISLCAVVAIAVWAGVAVSARVERQLQRGHARMIAAMREEITGEIMQDMLERSVGRARVYGAVTEARLTALRTNGKVAHLHRER